MNHELRLRGAGHVVSVLVDHHRGGGRIRTLWVGDAENVLARARAISQLDPKIAFEMIGPADARARLERAIIAGECPQQQEEAANVASARAILRARRTGTRASCIFHHRPMSVRTGRYAAHLLRERDCYAVRADGNLDEVRHLLHGEGEELVAGIDAADELAEKLG